MGAPVIRVIAAVLAVTVVVSPSVRAQTTPAPTIETPTPPAPTPEAETPAAEAPAATPPLTTTPAPGAETPAAEAPPATPPPAIAPMLRAEQLDQLLAPIALYPDALLAQILMAATYPLESVKAKRGVGRVVRLAASGRLLAEASRGELQLPGFQLPVPAWSLEGASQPELQPPGFQLRALVQGASEFRSWAPEWSAPEPTERRRP